MKAVNVLTGEVEEVAFFTAYHRPLKDSEEKMSDETKTEMAYVPPTIQIAAMQEAGARLAESRRAEFGDKKALTAAQEESSPVGIFARQIVRDRADQVMIAKGALSTLAAQYATRLEKQKKEAADAAKSAQEAAIEAEVQKRLAARSAAQPEKPPV